jgi:hypothetical protein
VRYVSKLCLALAAALVGSACPHDLQDGQYSFTREDLDGGVVDTCSTMSAGDTVLTGKLLAAGNDLVFTVTPIGAGSTTKLYGQFKAGVDGQPDEMLIDGTVVDQPFTLGGASCSVHNGQLALSGTQDTSTSFHGTFTSFYDLYADQPGCPIRCDLSVGYRAVRTGP